MARTNTYELIYIVWPKMSDEEIKKEHQKFFASLKPFISKVISEAFWGRKALAYPIKKFREGYFILVNFETDSDKIKEIDKRFRLKEGVIRYLIIQPKHDFKRVMPRRVIKKEKLVEEKPKIEKTKSFMEKKAEKKKTLITEDLGKRIDKILESEVIK